MFKKILIAIVVIVAVFIGIVAIQPSDFRITRTITISAPASAVFAQVNDFHNWEAWSPYEKRDPAMKKYYEGAPAGTGAIYRWSGNKEVGEGSTTIIESRPYELIGIKLEFIQPFAATNTAEFTFKPEGDQTAVTWSLTGKNNFISKTICLFIDMDKMVGGDFEQGLAALKSLVESAPTGDLTISRTFDAPREAVWQAWTEPERVKRWWGPKAYTAPVCKMDLREGGKYLYCMRSPEGQDFWSTGVYREIVAPERLVYSHSFADEEGNVVPATHYSMSVDFPLEMQVTVTFEAEEGKAKVTLHHHGMPKAMFELAKSGWNESLDKLAASLKS
jgi:uncharacterized protein YndB with AHSA1/START domain